MRRVLKIALAGAAIAAATPACAVTVISSPAATTSLCSDFTFSVADTECAGGYTGNLIQGTLQAPGPAAVTALGGSSSTYLATQVFSGSNTVLDFGMALSGPVIIGIHYGAAGDGTEATSFFLFNFTTPTSTLTVNSRDDTNTPFGLSNAALFMDGPVPEPATWAMMLLGFAGIGIAVRRSRRTSEDLMQLA
ncbi:MAG TPA: PEPxxWA-CTERM sorting domain-containing protein [Sphingomicrobium sp.]|nr:PEPxxWA-CTERM sorting domain-containing protein [Sphingomicrobium sp.]